MTNGGGGGGGELIELRSQMCLHARLTRRGDATACRGSDTLLLLNEANALEAGLSRGVGGGYGRRGGLPVSSGSCVYTRCGSSVTEKPVALL